MSKRSLLPTLIGAAVLLAPAAAQDLVIFRDPANNTQAQYRRYLNNIGLEQLRKRDAEIARITSREAMERRKKEVREKILKLIGGLPDQRGPLNVKQAGVLKRDGYRIEKIVYESLPGFYVPANVYVPEGAGPFPAILNVVGHWGTGKAGERELAIALAKKGFIVLKPDPLGQGERLQYWDKDLRVSRVGGPTDEHSHANGHTSLIGDNVARYEIWDGMRGIDYLLTRKDVDGQKIGCTGCSGGGTQTTYISALDDRVKVAAPTCYITAWQELLPGPGPQDAEQSFPRFLAEGLNIADYVELFAPKPWIIGSTTEDFFPLAGSTRTYEEAKGIYRLYGAEDRISRVIGPGPHGTPTEVREGVTAWFIRWLKDGKGDAREPAVVLDPEEEILCTATGQVADSLGGETVYSLNRKRAAGLIAPKTGIAGAADLNRLRTKIAAQVRSVAAVEVQPGGAPPELKVHQSLDRQSYRLDVVSFETAPGISVPGLLFLPLATAGAKPALLVADSRAKQALAAPGSDLDELAKAGWVVLAIQPRGLPEVPPAQARPFAASHQAAALANIVGKTLVGMRVEDLIRAVDYLASLPVVDAKKIAAYGRGALGTPLLHAAVLDARIGRLVLDESLAAYRMAVDRPVHRNIYEVALTGVLRHYDLDDLLVAVNPRPVTILNPVDALGVPLLLRQYREQCRYVFASEAKLGTAERVRVERRGRQDPLAKYLR